MRSEAPDRAFELADIARTELRDLLDLQLSPLGLRAIEALGPRPGEVIVDVGCGCGQTTLQLAEAVGPVGRVIGVDIAPRSLAAARERRRVLGRRTSWRLTPRRSICRRRAWMESIRGSA